MQKDWPTKDDDLLAAAEIINKYAELEDDGKLSLLAIHIDQEERVQVRAPSWMRELSEYFGELYGKEQGHQVTQKVITKCLLRNVTIH